MNKTFLLSALIAAGIALAPAAYADDMKKDGMSKMDSKSDKMDKMDKKDAMKKDAMDKDKMKKDEMKK